MAAKLTVKQESFCLAYIETGNASEAYRQVYNCSRMKPATINRKAAELLENGKITARLEELQAEHRKRHDVTVDSITAEYEEARQLAIEMGQPSAAVAASTGKARLHGIVIDKKEITGKNGTPLTPPEIVVIEAKTA